MQATWMEFFINSCHASPADIARDPLKQAIHAIKTPRAATSFYKPYPELSPIIYGLALFCYAYFGINIIQHPGAGTGFHSNIVFIPDLNLGVFAACNDGIYGSMWVEKVVWRKVVDEMLDLKPIDWLTR